MKKYGDKGEGKVLSEPGDDQKTAAANWTEDDQKALEAENAGVDG